MRSPTPGVPGVIQQQQQHCVREAFTRDLYGLTGRTSRISFIRAASGPHARLRSGRAGGLGLFLGGLLTSSAIYGSRRRERPPARRAHEPRLRRGAGDAARRRRRACRGGSGTTVLLKREDLQPVFSFKLRGAYNRIAHLSRRGARARRDRGQRRQPRAGRRLLGPPPGPARRDRDAEDDARDQGGGGARTGGRGRRWPATATPTPRPTATRSCAENGLAFVHPFDDPLVIAGQGTIGEEILRQRQGRLDAVFVPVGGGGLIAGIAGYLKALMPEVRIIGVEPFEADAMYRSLEAGQRVQPRPRRDLRRRRGGARGGRAHLRDRAPHRGRDRARHERRDLRRHQGRLRRHAQRDGAGGRARGGRAQGVGRPRATRAASAWWPS